MVRVVTWVDHAWSIAEVVQTTAAVDGEKRRPWLYRRVIHNAHTYIYICMVVTGSLAASESHNITLFYYYSIVFSK